MNLRVGRMVIGAVQTNCYFVYDEEQEGAEKDVLLFDPADKGAFIYDQLKAKGFRVAAIFLTHAHFDHIWGVQELRGKSGARVYAYEGEQPLCESSEMNVSAQVGRPCTVKPNAYLKDGEEISVAGITCKVIATPGHTIGSCCYYFEKAGVLISGDTLFQESVGRTDLPTGSGGQLRRSIQDRLFVLPDDTKVYPGHGDATTIRYEKAYNPFCS